MEGLIKNTKLCFLSSNQVKLQEMKLQLTHKKTLVGAMKECRIITTISNIHYIITNDNIVCTMDKYLV